MCGRLDTRLGHLAYAALIHEILGGFDDFDFADDIDAARGQSYNRAPTQELLFVGNERSGLAKWGLPKVKGSGLIINARGETIDQLPTFRTAFRESRIVVPASGWYEWGKAQKPHHFAIGDIAFFAGLMRGDRLILITTDPNDAAALVHDRMPALIPADQVNGWLTCDSADAKAMIGPWQGELEVYEVGPAVSNVRNHGPECAAPLYAEKGKNFLFEHKMPLRP